MDPDCHLDITACCLCRNYTTMADPPLCYFLGLLLLAFDLGLHVAHSYDQLSNRLAAGWSWCTSKG